MRDRRSFLLQTNERDRQSFDVFDVAADGYARTLLFRNPGGYYPGPASPDRRYVALTRPRTTSDADVWLHDRRTGATTNLTAHTGVMANAPADFTPDGSALLLLTNAGHEFTYLVRHDLATGARTTLLRPEWDVSFAEFSETGRYLVVGFAAGEIPKIPVNLLLLKGSALVGVFWGEFVRREPALNAENMRLLFSWLHGRRIRPLISRRYPLSQAPAALEALLARQAVGKLVVLPQQVE